MNSAKNNLKSTSRPPLIEKPWQLSIKEITSRAQADTNNGLSTQEANVRLNTYGPNRLDAFKRVSLVQLFLEQFTSPLVWVLAIAAVLAFSFQEWLEGFAILAVILLNTFIGFFMERQAIRSMESLRKLAMTSAKVYRDGRLVRLRTTKLVPGDLVFVEAGDIVSADGRIVQESNLGVKEASLTGESDQVSKETDLLKGEVPLADRTNMLFKGTTISRGNAKFIVTATGSATELGKINILAEQSEEPQTPLEQKLQILSRRLIGLTFLLTAIILVIGIIQEQEIYLMVKTAIALGIAAIPEGLPIVATIALARGMLRLARHRVIVRRLSEVETLGETDVIFTDKTGTLTKNFLSVDTIVFEFGEVNLQLANQHLQFADKESETLRESYAYEQLVKVAALCNNASLDSSGDLASSVGDPLEIALLEFSEASGMSIKKVRDQFPRVKEIPFSSESKLMGTLHKNGTRPDFLVCMKGALEVVLNECDYVLTSDRKIPLKNHKSWIKKADELGTKGLRVLSFAYSEVERPTDQFAQNLVFIGMIGFLDPPRPDVPEAIATCKKAGIRVVMVTGDHPETAKNIAQKIRLADKDPVVVHGAEFEVVEEMKKDKTQSYLEADVFARVSPVQKLDLVKLYQNNGHIVGMTGDGINDAPALKKADIGIAMGQRGTEAAKEASDLILEDDAFTSIVVAIKQGRGIFQNIRYFVVYLLSCNLSEIIIVATAALTHIAPPLLPLQILFLNMVTDVFPALALGMTRESDDVMERPPRKSKEPIINPGMWTSIVIYAMAMTVGVLGVALYAIYFLQATAYEINNLTFYTLILAQLWHVFNLVRSDQSFLFNEISRNRYVWIALLLCILITIVAYFIPLVRNVLGLHEIDWNLLWVIFPFSLIPVLLVQILKRTRILL